VTAHRLGIDEARRIAVRAAGLAASPPRDLAAMVEGIAMLRVELTPTVAPAADHIAWSRLGSGYRRGDADRALADRVFFERAWMVRPMADLGLYLAGMRTWPDRSGARRWMTVNAPFARGVLERIGDEGPLTSRQLPDEAVEPWPSSGWTNNRNVTQMLECLHMSGELAVVGRAGRLRIWDLADRVFPAVPEVAPDDARRIRSERLLAACGIMRDSIAVSPGELHGVVPVGEPAVVDGVPGTWRVDPSQLGRDFQDRTTLLSPFDRLLTDPARVDRLFDFDYTLEMYKPREQRRWGQFALPILHNDRLVGKLDARSDHERGRFVVNAVHEDAPFDPATRASVDQQIEAFADWLGLDVERAGGGRPQR
jgi:uncharacterized protein YcaQ